jgi:hypothetical protein
MPAGWPCQSGSKAAHQTFLGTGGREAALEMTPAKGGLGEHFALKSSLPVASVAGQEYLLGGGNTIIEFCAKGSSAAVLLCSLTPLSRPGDVLDRLSTSCGAHTWHPHR